MATENPEDMDEDIKNDDIKTDIKNEKSKPDSENEKNINRNMTEGEKGEEHFQNRKKIDHAVSIIVSIILLLVFNSLPVWNIPFLTGNYIKCLWAIDLSIGSTIIINFIFLFYEKEWFKHFMQIFLDIFALIAIIVLYYIFPFSFSSKVWEKTVSIALIIIMVITGISVIYEIARTILSIKFKKPAV